MTELVSAAIAKSSANAGAVVVLDRFTYEDETALADAAEMWCYKDETRDDHTVYTGAGWRVELVGDGDPRVSA